MPRRRRTSTNRFRTLAALASLCALCAAQTVRVSEHRYNFDERAGDVARDLVGSAAGMIGPDVRRTPSGALRFNGASGSYVRWEKPMGQFGTGDFVVGFRIRATDVEVLREVLGNRAAWADGNFFAIRIGEGKISAEVDEDARGKNYIGIASRSRVDDGFWHSVRVTRQGRRLSLQIDDLTEATGEAAGVANVRNDVPFQAATSSLAKPSPFIGEIDDLFVAAGAGTTRRSRSSSASL